MVRPPTRLRCLASSRQTHTACDGTTESETSVALVARLAGPFPALVPEDGFPPAAVVLAFDEPFLPRPPPLLSLFPVIPSTNRMPTKAIASAATIAAREGGPGGRTRLLSGGCGV